MHTRANAQRAFSCLHVFAWVALFVLAAIAWSRSCESTWFAKPTTELQDCSRSRLVLPIKVCAWILKDPVRMEKPHIHSLFFRECEPVGPTSPATAQRCSVMVMQVRWFSTNMSNACWATSARVHCDVNVPPLCHASPGPTRSIEEALSSGGV